MVIVSIVGAIGGYSYLANENRLNFNNAVSETISLIKQARNFAISSKSVFFDRGNGREKIVPEGGYGVFFTKDMNAAKIILFSDIWNNEESEYVNTNFNNPTDRIYPDHIYTAHKDLLIDSYLFPYKINLSDIKLDGVSTGTGVVLYNVPFAETIITDNKGNKSLEIEIEINTDQKKDGDSLRKRTIFIHKISGFPKSDF